VTQEARPLPRCCMPSVLPNWPQIPWISPPGGGPGAAQGRPTGTKWARTRRGGSPRPSLREWPNRVSTAAIR
jgi:hypothetical protein